MDRFLYLTTALAAALALSAPAAHAGLGINGPALEGQRVVLPDESQTGGTPVVELQKITTNGPGLDGQQVVLPDGSQTGGMPIMQLRKITSNGPALDGRQVVTPDLAEQRWPGPAQNLQVQQ